MLTASKSEFVAQLKTPFYHGIFTDIELCSDQYNVETI